MVAGAGYIANCFCIAMFVLFVAALASIIVWLDRRRRRQPGFTEPYRVTDLPLDAPPSENDEASKLAEREP